MSRRIRAFACPLLFLVPIAAACGAKVAVDPQVTSAAGGAGATGGAGASGGSGGAISAGGSGGVAMVCAPGTTQPCPYGGPAGTENVGACKAGARTCNAAGTAWSACAGEVLPKTEDCSTTTVDESCDGVPTCNGTLEFTWTAPGATILDMAANAAGELLVLGGFSGTVDLGGGPIMGEGGQGTTFVMKRDPQGNYLWAKTFTANGGFIPTSIAADPAGGALFTGSFFGALDLGGGPLMQSGAFLARFSP
jgi:hypothetical protein